MRNLIFLISEAQRNFRNKLFDLAKAQGNFAIAERYFRTKLNATYLPKSKFHNTKQIPQFLRC